MTEKGPTSKLTRALAKDLQGERVVYRNFKEGEISILRSDRKKRLVARRGFFGWGLLWKIVFVIFVMNMSMLFYFKGYKNVGITKGLNGWIAAVKIIVPDRENPSQLVVATDDTGQQKKLPVVKKKDDAACMIKKSPYGNVSFSLEKELRFAKSCLQVNSEKIYCWDDEQGITHFSNTGFPLKGYFFPKWVKHR